MKVGNKSVAKKKRSQHHYHAAVTYNKLLLVVTRAQNVAMIIGGVSSMFEDVNLNTVELYGCPDGLPHRLAEYPHEVYLAGAGLFEDVLTGEAFVMACGGTVCEGNDCVTGTKCYEYRPESLGDMWIESIISAC